MPTRFIITILLALSLGGFTPTSINPRDYGVTFSGADDTAGWQAAINAAIDEGLPIAAPCGVSVVKGRLNINSPMTFAGGGIECTVIEFPTPDNYLFLVWTPQAVTFRDFSIYCAGASQIQYGISFYIAPPAWNLGSVISHVGVANCDVGIDLYTNSLFVVDGVIIRTNGAAVGVRVADTNQPDQGDGAIVNSTFINEAPTGEAILQYSGGGLKVANNKIYGWYYGYLLTLQGPTSELQIIGNNFDHVGVCVGGTSGFSGVIVANNLCR